MVVAIRPRRKTSILNLYSRSGQGHRPAPLATSCDPGERQCDDRSSNVQTPSGWSCGLRRVVPVGQPQSARRQEPSEVARSRRVRNRWHQHGRPQHRARGVRGPAGVTTSLNVPGFAFISVGACVDIDRGRFEGSQTVAMAPPPSSPRHGRCHSTSGRESTASRFLDIIDRHAGCASQVAGAGRSSCSIFPDTGEARRVSGRAVPAQSDLQARFVQPK